MLDDVSDQLADRIAERTDGVPLFVEELTRSILESGRAPSLNVEIPDSLQGSLMARLDRLTAAAKEVAQIASVIGREFDRRPSFEGRPSRRPNHRRSAAPADVHPNRRRRRCGAGRTGVSPRAHSGYGVPDRFSAGGAAHYHEAIAKVLIDEYPDLVVTQPELIAQHYVKAQPRRACVPLLDQGR